MVRGSPLICPVSAAAHCTPTSPSGLVGVLACFWARVRPDWNHQAMGTLTQGERALLDFAARWWKYPGAQEQAIRDLFDMSGTRYWQLLNDLIDRPEALAYAPTTVHRYRRMRAARQAARSMRSAHSASA